MCVEWGWHIYNIVESESDPLTRRAIDLFKKEPLKGNSEVHLHTPTKFGEDRSKDLGGDREQTDRQTDKRCSIYSMIQIDSFASELVISPFSLFVTLCKFLFVFSVCLRPGAWENRRLFIYTSGCIKTWQELSKTLWTQLKPQWRTMENLVTFSKHSHSINKELFWSVTFAIR